MGIKRELCLGLISIGLAALIVPLAATPGDAQVRVHGLTRTLALPESMDKFYSGVEKGLVAAGDGVDWLTDVNERPRERPGIARGPRARHDGRGALHRQRDSELQCRHRSYRSGRHERERRHDH